jgi:hypothetical protein
MDKLNSDLFFSIRDGQYKLLHIQCQRVPILGLKGTSENQLFEPKDITLGVRGWAKYGDGQSSIYRNNGTFPKLN